VLLQDQIQEYGTVIPVIHLPGMPKEKLSVGHDLNMILPRYKLGVLPFQLQYLIN
jgi:hypothetical protein